MNVPDENIPASQHHLVPDETLPLAGPTRVRVSPLLPEDSDLYETEWLQAAAADHTFDFLKDPEEDIYTLFDGRLFYAGSKSRHGIFSVR